MAISHTQKTIIGLLADGRFHSGTTLAEALGISRSGIWKHLQTLDELGLRYAAVNGKGYRLEAPLQLLESSAILRNIDAKVSALIASFELFDQIRSTNTYLLQRAADNAPSGSICLAEQQTMGRGRRGRHWVSPFGSNIYLSILWRFQSGPAALSGLSLAIGVAVMRALNAHFSEAFQLKWPNDIFHDDKKLGGILVEVTGESGGPCAAVVGLGLNLSLSLADAISIEQEWTDLSRIVASNRINRNQLAATLLSRLLEILAEFEQTGIAPYSDEWRRYDCLKDRPGTLYVGDHRFDGIVKGIDSQGLLLLSCPDGSVKAFASGEVSFKVNR